MTDTPWKDREEATGDPGDDPGRRPERRSYSARRLALVILGAALLILPHGTPSSADGTAVEPAPVAIQSPGQLGFSESMSVGVVLVPVVVRSQGQHVRDLDRDDFELFVDGHPVKIRSFEKGTDSPIRVVFLQDVSGSMAIDGRLARSRALVPYFLGIARPADRFALASFAVDQVTIDVPFTDDAGALREAAEAWTARGTTGLHDAVAWLPEIAIHQPTTRYAAILLTDGIDNASTIDPEEARAKVRRARIPVYVIALKKGQAGLLEPPSGPAADEKGVLRLLAHESGGRFHTGENPRAVLLSGARILNDLRYQYVLGFPTADSGAVGSRNIQVRVDRKKVELTYRRGYEGTAPSAGIDGVM